MNGQNNRVWSAKIPQTLHKNTLHLSTATIWHAGSRRRIAGSLFFEETITAENYRNLVTQFTALQEDSWFQQDGATAHSTNRTSFLHVKPSVMALRCVRFWHHHPKTSCHLTPFCGNFLKKESTAITQESWKILKIILKSLLLALINKFFEMWQETL
jgi:hypothetical protein